MEPPNKKAKVDQQLCSQLAVIFWHLGDYLNTMSSNGGTSHATSTPTATAPATNPAQSNNTTSHQRSSPSPSPNPNNTNKNKVDAGMMFLNCDGTGPGTSGPPTNATSPFSPVTNPPAEKSPERPKPLVKRKPNGSLETQSDGLSTPFCLFWHDAEMPVSARSITEYLANIGALCSVTKTNFLKSVSCAKLPKPDALVTGRKHVLFHLKDNIAEKLWKLMKSDAFWQGRRSRNEAVYGNDECLYNGLCRGIDSEHHAVSMFVEFFEHEWIKRGKKVYCEFVRNSLTVVHKNNSKTVYHYKDLLQDHSALSREVFEHFTVLGKDLLCIVAVQKGVSADVFQQEKKK